MRKFGAITGGGRTADPAIHAVAPEEKHDASQAAKAAPNQTSHPYEFKPTQLIKDDDSYVPPKKPCYPSSGSCPKVHSTGVNQPPEPVTQQKRGRSFFYSNGPLKGADCAAGLDGTPWPDDKQQLDREREREEQVKDNKEYFQHHKASPLSELEMADTRKPVTRVTDGTADSSYHGCPDLVLWRPEQLDTAEESLRRAMEIWKSNAMRGDPDSPHGRILRTLRGEYW